MYAFPHLPPSLGRAMFSELCRGLPPPHDGTDAARDDRDMFAMAAVRALDARDAAEAMIAMRVVQHEAQARHSLACAALHDGDFDRADKCRAQAALMGREAQRALRSLQAVQATRPLAPPGTLAETEDTQTIDPPIVPPGVPPKPAKPRPYGMERPLPPGFRWETSRLSPAYEALFRKMHAWDDPGTRPAATAAESGPAHA